MTGAHCSGAAAFEDPRQKLKAAGSGALFCVPALERPRLDRPNALAEALRQGRSGRQQLGQQQAHNTGVSGKMLLPAGNEQAWLVCVVSFQGIWARDCCGLAAQRSPRRHTPVSGTFGNCRLEQDSVCKPGTPRSCSKTHGRAEWVLPSRFHTGLAASGLQVGTAHLGLGRARPGQLQQLRSGVRVQLRLDGWAGHYLLGWPTFWLLAHRRSPGNCHVAAKVFPARSQRPKLRGPPWPRCHRCLG